MFSTWSGIGLAWVGTALLALAPISAFAETIVLRNDTQMAVNVRPISVLGGIVRQSRVILLNPKASTVPGIMLPGDKIIVIYDASVPTRMLYKGTIPVSPMNSAYAIQADTATLRLKLVPIPFPVPPKP